MDEALKKSGDYPNIALTPWTHRHAATGETVEIPASARMDGASSDSDAVAFCKRVENAAKERKPLTLFGVNYEAVCDVPFCEQVDRWLHGDAPSECRECADGKYDELTALVDNRELGLENTIIGLHDALIEATCTIVELDAEKAGGMAMAVEYYAHKLRQFGFDVPPTPMEESEMDE